MHRSFSKFVDWAVLALGAAALISAIAATAVQRADAGAQPAAAAVKPA
jgi:hypothetical protein